MKSEIVRCHNLSIGHKTSLKSNFSFNITEGEVTFLQGRNGSGKSTLIKTLLGEVALLAGHIDWNVSPHEISYLPQITKTDIHASYTIGEILEIYNVLKEHQDVFSPSLLKKKWADSSGGEKQKTLILINIKTRTKFLILDEPFNHLDKESIELIKKLLSDLIFEKKIKSLLLVSHFKIDIEGINVKEIHL